MSRNYFLDSLSSSMVNHLPVQHLGDLLSMKCQPLSCFRALMQVLLSAWNTFLPLLTWETADPYDLLLEVILSNTSAWNSQTHQGFCYLLSSCLTPFLVIFIIHVIDFYYLPAWYIVNLMRAGWPKRWLFPQGLAFHMHSTSVCWVNESKKEYKNTMN